MSHINATQNGLTFTEDATLVRTAGYDVTFIEGNETNIKVTTQTDIRLAEFLLTGESDRDA